MSQLEGTPKPGPRVISEAGSLLSGIENPVDDRFRELVEQLPAITYVAEFTASAPFVYVSPQIEQVLGYAPHEWIERPSLWAERLHPEDRARVLQEEERTYHSETLYEGEFRMVARDGRVVWFAERDTIIRDIDGRPKYTQGMLFDVTELHAARSETRTERDRAQQYLAVAWTLVLGLDRDAKVTLVNRRTCDVLGYQEHELIGQDWIELMVPAEERALTRQLVDQVFEGGELLADEYENVVHTRSGEPRRVIWHSTIVRDDDGRAVGTLNSGEDVTDRRQAEEKIVHLAYHDPVTALPNRARLSEDLHATMARAEREDGSVALLLANVDDFKLVNEGLGHDVGDQLLRAVAGRLTEIARHNDLVAHPGGDEFMVLLGDLPAQAGLHASAAARRVLEVFDRPFEIGGAEFYLNASVGVSVAPRDAEDADALMRHADQAMRRAKQSERGGFALYEADDSQPLERLSLTARLRRAVERDELVLHYQPIYSLTQGAPVAVEALVRWEDPERGLVPPDQFIPAAEQSGLIEPIGAWVVSEACRQLAEWGRLGLEPAMSVNASPRELRRSNFVRHIAHHLRQNELPAERLTVEITESTAMHDAGAASPLLEELAGLGVNIAVDDFGDGFSSLGRLRQLPVGELKIDRSFMRDVPADPGAAAVVTAIVGLGEALGCDVVAEGVETEEQRTFLAEHGCPLAQGFHLARPLTAPDATALLLRAA